MAATGAADRDGQVVAVVARIGGKPTGDEMIDVPIHPLDFGKRREEPDDRFVAASERRQRGLIVGIGQAPDVEYQIGIQRDAVLEAEGL